jgi:hypothetical protein
MKPQELIFSYLNVLLRQFDQSQQDIYVNEIDAIREYALSENQGLAVSAEGVIASGLFVALGAVPSPLLGSVLSEAAKRLGFFIGEQLVLSDIWSATITYPGTGRMEVVYRLSASKILVSAYLEEPINRNIFIIIPVKLEPMRTSWGTGFCPLSTGINCPPEYAIRELVPKMGDVTIVSGFSPIELRVFDLQGRVTGLVSGVVKAEIPESGYVDDTVVIFSADSPYLYQSGGECSAAYGLQITFVKDENATDFFAADIPTSAMQIHNYTVDWAVLSPGGEGVTVKVDCEGDGDFEYAFTSDSELSRIEYVAATTQHDLGITGITSSKSVTGEGYSLPINMTTINYGVYTETFNVSFYVNTTLVESQTVTLASGNSTTITFTWNTTDALYGNYALSAYAEPVLNETYVADNNCTWIVHVGVPGDVSSTTPGVYDGVTNMKDIAYMVALFNTRPESPNWNPNADVNNDGVCNMKDIAICVAYFNQRE